MEYSVIGVIVVGAAIALLEMVGGTFQGTLSGLKQDMATHRDAAIQQEIAVLSAGRAERLDSLSKAFSTAEMDLLKQSLTERVQTVGANGSTRLLAKQLSLLADKLLSEGKITQDQYALLMELSNQGYHIARLETLLEDGIQQAGGDASVFAAIRFNVDGQDQSVQDLANTIGFVGITPVTSEAFLANAEHSAGLELNRLLLLYQQIRNSGVLTDPVVQATVESAVIQIAQVGEGVEDSLYQGITANQLASDPLSFNGEVASAVTKMSSDKVCKAGNYKSNGVECTP